MRAQGRLQEAAAAYTRAGEHGRAVAMFNGLRMFSEAASFSAAHAARASEEQDERLLVDLSALVQAPPPPAAPAATVTRRGLPAHAQSSSACNRRARTRGRSA